MNLLPPRARDATLMGAALAAARLAAERDEVPVAALLVTPQGAVFGPAANSRRLSGDPTAHAEVNVIREATAQQAPLPHGCTLVVTLEPCVMCAGTILAARISRVVFGAWDEKAGAAGSVYDLLRDGRLPYPVPEVVAGVRARECAQVLEQFFRQRR